jgi:predicted metal-dependent HD superfamily phosphohydrolase
MNYIDLSARLERHVQDYFHSRKTSRLPYHNLDHTLIVVEAASQMADHYQISDRDRFVIVAAAWFHDLGYFVNADNHEEYSVHLAQEFLHELQVEPETIALISDAILTTRIPQLPKTRLQEILCDADLFHFGIDDFWQLSKRLRKELELRENRPISKAEWRERTLETLGNHQYFTDYCKLLLGNGKNENINRLQKKESIQSNKMHDQTNGDTVGRIKKMESKINDRNRFAITMFRVSSSNNQRLSDMADRKAHIMISVNAIILSAIISLVLRRLDQYSYMAWPTYLIICVAVLTMIYCILATRPSLPRGNFKMHELEEKKVNLLFFGNYTKMSLEDYTLAMEQVLNNVELSYKTLIKDVYAQGLVLERKYKFLRKAYNIFMYGVILSALAFITASITSGKIKIR